MKFFPVGVKESGPGRLCVRKKKGGGRRRAKNFSRRLFDISFFRSPLPGQEGKNQKRGGLKEIIFETGKKKGIHLDLLEKGETRCR